MRPSLAVAIGVAIAIIITLLPTDEPNCVPVDNEQEERAPSLRRRRRANWECEKDVECGIWNPQLAQPWLVVIYYYTRELDDSDVPQERVYHHYHYGTLLSRRVVITNNAIIGGFKTHNLHHETEYMVHSTYRESQFSPPIVEVTPVATAKIIMNTRLAATDHPIVVLILEWPLDDRAMPLCFPPEGYLVERDSHLHIVLHTDAAQHYIHMEVIPWLLQSPSATATAGLSQPATQTLIYLTMTHAANKDAEIAEGGPGAVKIGKHFVLAGVSINLRDNFKHGLLAVNTKYERESIIEAIGPHCICTA